MATDIVIADAQGTPVNHTFVPAGRDSDGRFWFIDQSQSNAIGFWRISVKEKFPATPRPGDTVSGRNYRVEIALHEPALETSGNSSSGYVAQPRVAYITRGTFEWIMPEAGTLQNRKDIVKMMPLVLQNSQIKAVAENLSYLS